MEIINDFQIISKLGEGTYSTVFKVKRNKDNMIYALKKVKLLNLSEKEKENSLNEVRLLANIKSNFVISYKDAFFDEKDNTLNILLEFADRGDLYQKITQYKKYNNFFEESDIWRIFIQLVEGLKALHDLNILYHDMKSSNVFLFSDGRVKLGDLNLSKVAKNGLGFDQTGNPYYASPEIWKDLPHDNKSDIWSLGCVLYEMITLRPPFRAQDREGLFNKVCKGKYDKIPNRFSDDLSDIVKILLEVNPSDRPSCVEILKIPLVKKRIEYFKSFAGENEKKDIFLSIKSKDKIDKKVMKTFKIKSNDIKIKEDNKKNELLNQLNEEKNKNKILLDELNKEKIKFKELNDKIKIYENSNNEYIKKLKELEELIKSKNKEINNLKTKNKSNEITTIESGDKIISQIEILKINLNDAAKRYKILNKEIINSEDGLNIEIENKNELIDINELLIKEIKKFNDIINI